MGPSARCSCVGGCGGELVELVSLPVASCRVWVNHGALPWHSSGQSGQNPQRIWSWPGLNPAVPATGVRICHNPLRIPAATSPSPEQILVSITEQGRLNWQQQNIPCVAQVLGSSRIFWAGCCAWAAGLARPITPEPSSGFPWQLFLLRLGWSFAEGWASPASLRMSRQPGAAPRMDSACPPCPPALSG